MKIAYVVSMFPKLSETFILRELIELDKAGAELSIFSIKCCNEKVLHDDALAFKDRTVYLPPQLWPWIGFQHAYLMLMKPGTYFPVLKRLVFMKAETYEVRAKSLLIFWAAPYFYFHAIRRGIGHLHAHFATYPALLAWVLHRWTGVSFSVTAHAHDIYKNQDVLKLIFNEAKVIFTISEYNKNFIAKKLGQQCLLSPDKLQVNRCGIDLEKYKFNPCRPVSSRRGQLKRILSVGRLCEMKGFRYLLDALALLRQDGYEFVCDIIGEGPLMPQLAEQAATLGLTGYVSLVGAKTSTEVLQYLNEADIFVLACVVSKTEGHDGIPVVFMEAMALGVPVIGTHISGIPELIIHETTGLCSAPEDPVSLKTYLARLLNEEEKTQEMVVKARRLIEEQYDIVKTAATVRQCCLKSTQI